MGRLSTGVPGLDEILDCGLIPGRTYLVRGGPGTGKTTLGLHFLCADADEPGHNLLITLESSEADIRRDAERLGFDLGRVEFLDLSPSADRFREPGPYDIFPPAEVERDPTTRRILEYVERLRPRRVFVDAVTTLRLLAPDAYQFRTHVLAFMRFVTSFGSTLLLAAEASREAPDEDLEYMCDGIIELGYPLDWRYGDRVLQVSKFRGSRFRTGQHAMRLTDHGMEVMAWPELPERSIPAEGEPIRSGVPELDAMLHGGLERGTVTLLAGTAGAGKTTLGMLFAVTLARRGERAVVYTFEELPATLARRIEAFGIECSELRSRRLLEVVEVEPGANTPERLAHLLKTEVGAGTRLVLIDGVAGFRRSLRGADVADDLWHLCKYLRTLGVTVLLVDEVGGPLWPFGGPDWGIRHLADNILFLRHYAERGELRTALGVLRKRPGTFERSIREIEIGETGVRVGRPLTELHAILSGPPGAARS